MTIDTEALKARIDPIEYVSQDVELRRIGSEHHGPCPLSCGGGDDRFWVKPDGRWACRRCKAAGADIISYVRARDGSSFRDACEELARFGGLTLDDRSAPRGRRLRPRTSSESCDGRAPSPEWTAAALLAIEGCERQLWSEVGARARSYLGDRGLTDETIRAARLGLASKPLTMAGLYVPAGVTIPWLRDGDVVQLKVRTRSSKHGRKYRAARWDDSERAKDDGGHPWVYGVDHLAGRTSLVVTEGEFDALLLRQEAGGLVDVLTLGSATADWPEDARTLVFGYGRVLLLLDADEAGEGCVVRLSAMFATARHVPLPDGQDVTDYWRDGGDLRALLTPFLWRQPASAPRDG